MSIAKNTDLTQGEPEKALRRFCLPLFLSVIFQQLYNLADSFVSGRFISEDALAAVGNSYELTLVYLAFAFGCNIGCSVLCSQLFGAKRPRELKTAVNTAFFSTAVLCAVLMGAGLGLGERLLALIHTPENIMADSLAYLEIYTLSLPFVFFYNLSTGIFSALGDSRTPFMFLAVSSVANIGADILFVKAFGMGVAGVGWATLICQGVSCILAVIVVIRRLRSIESGRADLFSGAMLRKFAFVAVPSILQQSFISVGNIIIQGAVNSFGSGVVAGYSASVKLNNMVITSFTTLGNGMSNFTAQNLGGGKPERVKRGFRAGIKLVWMISLPVAVVYFFAGGVLIRLFLEEPTAAALGTGKLFLRILAPFYFIVSAKLIADGVLRGARLMKRFMAATFTDLVIRVVLAEVLSGIFGSTGIWMAWPIGWTTAAIMSVGFLEVRG